MALDFPAPAGQTPVNTFSPTSTPSATTNNLTYSYDGEKWVLNGSGAFVAVAGDTMTGNLGLPGGGGSTQALQSQEISALIAGASAGSLQAVTDVGNTTTNGITVGGGNIALNAGGGGYFRDDVDFGQYTNAAGGIRLRGSGYAQFIRVGADGTGAIEIKDGVDTNLVLTNDGSAYLGGDLTSVPPLPNAKLNADGSAEYVGNVIIGDLSLRQPHRRTSA